MARKLGPRESFRVVIEPASCTWIRTSNCSDDEITCDQIADQVKRHVDSVGSVTVEFDQGHVCEHCGSQWTEDSADYNGGCCGKDAEADPEALAA